MFAVTCAGENAVLFYDERLKLISKKIFEQPQLGLRRTLIIEDTLYITAANAGGVVKYNMKSGLERFRTVCAYPTDIVQTKNGIAVCCGESENVTAISRALNITKRVAAASFPISMSTADGEIFISCLASACVRVLDHTLNEKRVIQLSDYPYYTLHCGGSLVVAASEEGYLTSGRVHFIENGKIIKSVSVGAMPSRLIYLNGRIFCANTGEGTLSIIDAYKKNGSQADTYSRNARNNGSLPRHDLFSMYVRNDCCDGSKRPFR